LGVDIKNWRSFDHERYVRSCFSFVILSPPKKCPLCFVFRFDNHILLLYVCQVNDCLAILIYGYLCPLLKIICLQLHEA